MQSLTETLCHVRTTGQIDRQIANSRDLGRLLGVGYERCRKNCPDGEQEVPALNAIHAFPSLERRGKSTLDRLLRSIATSNDRYGTRGATTGVGREPTFACFPKKSC
jgi:hypothetical protein